MLEFKVFIDRKKNRADPFEVLLKQISDALNTDQFSYEIFDINNKEARDIAVQIGLEEVPAVLVNKTKISGQLNEYFLQAIVSQIFGGGRDQTLSKFTLEGDDATTKLYAASEFIFHKALMREDTDSFLFLIRETPDKFNILELKKAIEKGTTIFLLTNFEKGTNGAVVAELGSHDNVLVGHIMRDNMHMTMSITIRKNRPFFGSFVRAKFQDGVWKGLWSPLLHDTVSELKKFYLPLFSTASPVQLDGTLPDPPETNRVVAKVKDNVEKIKTLFF
ncbi:MAG: hypothetical protein D6732_13270 [Methanobacteriota archaeon]|nr:MAG: hypothetical protein D6732_13270 [Euryarchaeota archaeon]